MSEKRIIRVGDVMRKGYTLVDSRLTIREVMSQIVADDNHIVIVDKVSADDEYGLLRLSDIARDVLARDRSPDRVNVYEVMSKPALCVSGKMDIRNCARLFHRFNLHAAPVVDGGNSIIGAISYEQLVLKGLMQLDLGS